MLELNHVSKSYGTFRAVDDICLTVKKGETFGFIGKNGAGKSTTIKACVGIHDYDGEILYDGINFKEAPLSCKRKLAYVPDNPDLYESFTGVRYLNFVMDLFEIPEKVRADKVQRICGLLEIDHALSDSISTYSHGMKQKLALAGAFVHDPEILFLDEPFVGLDPEAIYHLKRMMRDFCGNGGSIFFSSHVLELVEKLCDRVAIIHKGRIVKMGTVSDIKSDRSLEDIFLEIEGDRHE